MGQACYAALFHHKLEETLLQIETASLLQIRASVENWGSYYKLGEPLLQNGAAIANWGNYYKLGHNGGGIFYTFPGTERSEIAR